MSTAGPAAILALLCVGCGEPDAEWLGPPCVQLGGCPSGQHCFPSFAPESDSARCIRAEAPSCRETAFTCSAPFVCVGEQLTSFPVEAFCLPTRDAEELCSTHAFVCFAPRDASTAR